MYPIHDFSLDWSNNPSLADWAIDGEGSHGLGPQVRSKLMNPVHEFFINKLTN